jgi:NadR type nicotinamide-nucleotide adenylyltransferase
MHHGTTRIVVTGSECTGKTTLAANLADALRCTWIPEYARSYAESVGRTLSSADVEPIARGQVEREDAILASGPSQFVLDTDLVSTVVYANAYYGSCPAWIEEAARTRCADLYLLCDIDLPWLADGVRDLPHARQEMHRRFVNRLAELGLTVRTIGGIGDARTQSALTAIAEFVHLR